MSSRSRGAADPNYWYLALGILLVASPAAMVVFDTGDATYRYERDELVGHDDGIIAPAPDDDAVSSTSRVLSSLDDVGCADISNRDLLCEAASTRLTNASGGNVHLSIPWHAHVHELGRVPYLQLVSNQWRDERNATTQLYRVHVHGDTYARSVSVIPAGPEAALDVISTPYEEAPATVRTAIGRDGFRSSDRIDDEWLGEVVERDDRHYVVTEVRRERYGGWPDDKRAVGYGMPTFFGVVAIAAGARGGLYR